MTHLDEGVLLALRDGSDAPDMADARTHLEDCAPCRDKLAEVRRIEAAVAGALTSLDESFDIETAREAVRARVAQASADAAGSPAFSRRAAWGSKALARAAGLVLVAAVGVSALPGSPVRNWIGSILSTGNEAAAVTPTEDARPTRTENAGIRVSVTAPAHVRVFGLAPGEDVSVLWVPGTEVAVFAASGSRFSSGQDGVEATVSHGPVRIELPLNVRPLTLEVGGQVWLRNLESGTEFLVAPEEEDRQPLRYVVPEFEVDHGPAPWSGTLAGLWTGACGHASWFRVGHSAGPLPG